MSLGKKIYTAIWAVTGGLLIALIAMFVALNNEYAQKQPATKGYSVTAKVDLGKDASGKAIALEDAIKTDKATLKVALTDKLVGVDGKEILPASSAVDTKVSVEAALKDADFAKHFNFETVTVKGETIYKYALGDLAMELTPKSASATNATATVGGLFLAGLMGSIFTTVGVSIKEKRSKGGSK